MQFDFQEARLRKLSNFFQGRGDGIFQLSQLLFQEEKSSAWKSRATPHQGFGHGVFTMVERGIT